MTGTLARGHFSLSKWPLVVVGLSSASLLGACGGDDETKGDGDRVGDLDSDDDATGGSGTGAANSASGGSSSTTDACNPGLSSRFVPCDTNTQVPALTEDFSVTGPFSPGDTVAVSVAASSGLGMTVQAYAEASSCSDAMTLIHEEVVPSADQTCVEVTLDEATSSVRWLLVQDTVSPASLFAVCGQCP